jgi:hypothetical protein
MPDRILRGERLGSQSLQDEHGVDFAPRKTVEYLTDSGRAFTVTFEADAEPPAQWVDQKSGQVGFLNDDAGKAAREEFEEKGSSQRTHWDMLLERRTREELNELLNDRLDALRKRRGTK